MFGCNKRQVRESARPARVQLSGSDNLAGFLCRLALFLLAGHSTIMKPLRGLLLVLDIPRLLTAPVTALLYRYGIACKKCVSWSALCILLICNHSSAAIYPDLVNNILTNTIASTNGLTWAEAYNQFSFIQYPNGAKLQYTVNPNFWFSFAPEKTASSVMKWTGTSTPTNVTDQEDVNLIAPCYAVTCYHAPTGVGTWVAFVDDNGSMVIRQVIATTNFVGTDVQLLVLNADVPTNTVHPYKELPPGVTNYIVNPMTNLAVEAKHQDQGWGAAVLSGDIVNSEISTVDPVDSNYLGTAWLHPTTGGDSGCPITVLIDTNLVLLGHWFFPETGENYVYSQTAVNNMMHYFSTNYNLSTDYQIQTVDLSQFQNYHVPSPPVNLHIEQ